MPTRYLRERVEVRGDSPLVRICHHGELLRVHTPQPPAAGPPTTPTILVEPREVDLTHPRIRVRAMDLIVGYAHA